MRLIASPVLLPVRAALEVWAWLWQWTYPLARPTIDEVRSAYGVTRFSLRAMLEALRFALELPLMARSQHYAERSSATRTGSSGRTRQLDSNMPTTYRANLHSLRQERWASEPLWRTGLREAVVWSTLASWLVTLGSISASVIFTGNFLFETHATPDAPGYVTPYFKVAAVAVVVPVGLIAIGLATLGVTRRTV